MEEEIETIEGQKITKIYTFGSMHDHNCIGLEDDEGNKYRMRVTEFLKLMNGLVFIKLPKAVHTYLEILEW